jgi:trigger factor
MGSTLEYTAEFEIYPEIDKVNVEGITIEKPVAEVIDADIDHIIESWRKMQATWKAVDRAATTDDRVTVDFDSVIDGEVTTDGRGEDAQIILGSNTMLPGFEEGLMGLKVGDEKELSINMPQSHNDGDVAGKDATVKVTVKVVEEPELPEVDDEFCKSHGIEEGGVDALREDIKKSLKLQFEKTVNEQIKRNVFDQLVALNQIDVPQTLVENEIASTKEQFLKSNKQHDQDRAKAHLETMTDQIAKQAKQTVTTGLLIGHFVSEHDLKPNPEKVNKAVVDMAQQFGGSQETVDMIYKQYQIMAQIVSGVLEESALEKLMELAQVKTVPTTVKDVLFPDKSGQEA